MSGQANLQQRITKSLTPEAAEITKAFGWDFFKAGALIVDEQPLTADSFENGLASIYVLVREAKVKELQPDGSSKWVLSDKGKWNLPCGRLQLGESFEAAAIREAREETGYKVKLDDLIHIGHRHDTDNPYVILIYKATMEELAEDPDPEEIAQVCWFNYDEIVELYNNGQLRNPELTMGAIEGYNNKVKRKAITVTTYATKQPKVLPQNAEPESNPREQAAEVAPKA